MAWSVTCLPDCSTGVGPLYLGAPLRNSLKNGEAFLPRMGTLSFSRCPRQSPVREMGSGLDP